MNELRESAAPDSATSMKCECECHRVECGNSFQITIDAYETVRTEGRRFVVTPGHQSDDEALISIMDTYLVIEKVGEQGAMAEELNPR
jgi:hypothetical protein